MQVKFYRCKICGKIITMVNETKIPTICCGEAMYELIPSQTDGTTEKHVPIISQKNNIVQVKVGSMDHPMSEDHYIQWIFLQTKQGFQYKKLKATDKPMAYFALLDNDEVVAAYEYCNIHQLWQSN